MFNLMTERRQVATLLLVCCVFGITTAQTIFAQTAKKPDLLTGQRSFDSEGVEAVSGQDERLPAPSDSANSHDQEPDGFEFLMRGPVHEAFADAYQSDVVIGPVIKQAPPEEVAEIPPEHQPDGVNIQWISGYWAWDDDTSKHIWISGLWRDVPPGQQWQPGTWTAIDHGYRWTQGYWFSSETTESTYVPRPPASIENGPSYDSPSDDYFYIPGNWLYLRDQYAWQSGYWCPRIDDRIWMPSHYVSTNRGYVYCPGYWDYTVENRGVLFAPVYFHRPVYLQNSWHYRPECVVGTNVDFLVHLFVHPGRSSYYFGDWYDQCGTYSYRPWVHTHYHATYHDPLFSYYRYRGYRHHDSNGYLINHLYKKHHHYASNRGHRPQTKFRYPTGGSNHQPGSKVNSIDQHAGNGELYKDVIKRPKRKPKYSAAVAKTIVPKGNNSIRNPGKDSRSSTIALPPRRSKSDVSKNRVETPSAVSKTRRRPDQKQTQAPKQRVPQRTVDRTPAIQRGKEPKTLQPSSRRPSQTDIRRANRPSVNQNGIRNNNIPKTNRPLQQPKKNLQRQIPTQRPSQSSSNRNPASPTGRNSARSEALSNERAQSRSATKKRSQTNPAIRTRSQPANRQLNSRRPVNRGNTGQTNSGRTNPTPSRGNTRRETTSQRPSGNRSTAGKSAPSSGKTRRSGGRQGAGGKNGGNRGGRKKSP